MKTEEVEAPTEPPSKCMAIGCSRDAVSALRITFVYFCKGFSPKKVDAWFGLYVCAQCGTQEHATQFAQVQEKNLLDLGQKIGNALGAQSFDIEAVRFDKRAGADKDFFAYTQLVAAHERQVAEETAARQSSIVDAANDPTNLH